MKSLAKLFEFGVMPATSLWNAQRHALMMCIKIMSLPDENLPTERQSHPASCDDFSLVAVRSIRAEGRRNTAVPPTIRLEFRKRVENVKRFDGRKDLLADHGNARDGCVGVDRSPKCQLARRVIYAYFNL